METAARDVGRSPPLLGMLVAPERVGLAHGAARFVVELAAVLGDRFDWAAAGAGAAVMGAAGGRGLGRESLDMRDCSSWGCGAANH